MKKRAISGRMVVAAALIAALIVAIVCASVLLERGQQRDRERELQVQSEALKASMWTDENLVDIGDKLYGFDHRLETFLFVGTDNSGSGNSDPEDFRGPMADFLLLMVLDHTKNTVGYLQIDRNTVTDVDEVDARGEVIDTRELQICTAHWYGRNPEMCAENTVNAVKSYLGDLENIDGYFVINMDDIGRLNHNGKVDDHYKLCRTTKEQNYHHRVMQIVDMNTTFIHSRSKDEDIEHGIYIDIIPIDACPNSRLQRFAQFFNAVIFSICNIQQKPEYNGGKLTGLMSFGTTVLLGIIRSQKARYKAWSRAEKRMTKYDWDSCTHKNVLHRNFTNL